MSANSKSKSSGLNGQERARAEVRAICMREDIRPGAVARELHIDPDDFISWLRGDCDLLCVEDLVDAFIRARRDTAERLRAADTATRAGFGRLLIRNAEILVGELAKAPKCLRGELEDQLFMQLSDLRRLLALIEGGEAATAERLVEKLRGALHPGDRLLILRGGAEGVRSADTGGSGK